MRCFVLLLCFFLPLTCSAQVLINEVYYDHPGVDGGHEFIELIATRGAMSLAGVELQFFDGNGTSWKTVWVGSALDSLRVDLFVIGGDRVTPRVDAIDELGLQNGPDAVRLRVDGQVVDVVGYGALTDPLSFETAPAPDVKEGFSVARRRDGIDSDNNALDFAASLPSPGERNRPHDDIRLSLSPYAAVAPLSGPVAVFVINDGTTTVTSLLRLAWTDSAAGVVAHDSVSLRPAIAVGDSARMDITLTPTPGYHFVRATVDVDRDQRVSNNSATMVRRVGTIALLVTEVMSHPDSDCPEFVEVLNAGAWPVDIAGYGVRDRANKAAVIRGGPRPLAAGAYAVVGADSAEAAHCYGVALSPIAGAWPSFNHTGSEFADSVIVVDGFGLPVDAVAYPPQPSSSRGHSLERVDLYRGGGHVWVLSRERGGTPGRRNTTVVDDLPVSAGMAVDPQVFDPYCGERTVVTLTPRTGNERAQVAVYDTDGRRVTTLGVANALPFSFIWDGRTDEGTLVTPGFYVVLTEFVATETGERRVERVVLGCARRE